MLIWENFGVSRRSRFFRAIFYFLFVLVMLAVCIYMITILENASNEAENELSGVQCADNIDAKAANLDYYADQTKRTGDFHCFCKNLLALEGVKKMEQFLFPLDRATHCREWYQRYLLIIVVIGGIAVLITVGNIVIELLVMYGSHLTRPVNKQTIISDAVRTSSWIQFINLGLVLLVINLKVKLSSNLKLPAGIFNGAYEDFSSMWYIDVGTQIMLSMLLEICAPHSVPLVRLAYYEIRRCWDRSCTCDKRKSKKLIQQDYEDLYTGPEFQLEARLAQIVSISWVTFMYSPGLPILFLFAIVNFTIIYWVDKILLLRFYRKPNNYDSQSVEFSVNEIKIAYLFHFFIGAFVYSNDRILSNSGVTELIDTKNKPAGEQEVQTIFTLERYNSMHVLIFSGGMCIMVLLIIFERTIFNFLLASCNCFKSMHETYEQMEAVSDDYYSLMSVKYLASEYERTKQEKQRYLVYMETHKHSREFALTSQILNKYVKGLKEKEKAILAKMNELA